MQSGQAICLKDTSRKWLLIPKLKFVSPQNIFLPRHLGHGKPGLSITKIFNAHILYIKILSQCGQHLREVIQLGKYKPKNHSTLQIFVTLDFCDFSIFYLKGKKKVTSRNFFYLCEFSKFIELPWGRNFHLFYSFYTFKMSFSINDPKTSTENSKYPK